MKNFFLIITLISLISFFGPYPTYAQTTVQSSAIAVSPAIYEKILDPGETAVQEVIVINQLDLPVPIKTQPSSFMLNETVIEGTNEKDRQRFDSSRWIAMDPSEFILDAKGIKKVKVIIYTPQDADPGGHYNTVYFNPVLDNQIFQQKAPIQTARVGLLSFYTVKGNINYDLKLKNLKTNYVNIFSDIDIFYTLDNKGNTHISPSTSLTIQNIFTKKVYTIKDKPFLVLPNTTRDIKTNWDSRMKFGIFKAKLNVNYAQNNKAQNKELIFAIIPIYVIIATLGTLTIFYLFFILRLRRLKLVYKVLFTKYDKSNHKE